MGWFRIGWTVITSLGGSQLFRHQISYALNNLQNRQTGILQQGLQVTLESGKYWLSFKMCLNIILPFMP
jgi:hypothetical protein